MLRILLQRLAQRDTPRSTENPRSLARIQYQRLLGLGAGAESRFAGGCSSVSVAALVDVLVDFRWVFLLERVVVSPVPSAVSFVFFATVSPVSLVFSPTVSAVSLVFSP